MKRISITLLLLSSFFVSKGQTSAAITYVRALNAGQYSCGFPGCITRAIEGHMHDTTLALLQQVLSAVSGATGLQGTLNAGSVANNTGGNTAVFELNDAASGFSVTHSPLGMSLNSSIAGANEIFLGIAGSAPVLSMLNPANFTGQLKPCPSATGNMVMYMPDEGTGSYPNNAITLHHSKLASSWYGGSSLITIDPVADKITLSDAAFLLTTVTPGTIINTNATITQWQLGLSLGYATLKLKDPASAFYSNSVSGALSANRTYADADRSGTRQLSGDGVNPTVSFSTGAGTGATATFSATSDDRSGTITLNSGTLPASGGDIITVTFTHPYSTPCRVIVQCTQPSTEIQFTNMICGTELNDKFTISGILTASTAYTITYIVAN